MKHLFLIFGFVLMACSTPEDTSQNGVPLEMAKYRKSVLSNIRYQLEFRIPENKDQRIQALEEITFDLSDASKDILLDFKAEEDKVNSLIINNKSQVIKVINEHVILPQEALQEGFNKVEINFFAGESSLNRKDDFLYTLFVPDRARTAFPVFDQPNLKAVFELTLDIPRAWKAISNAPMALERITGDRKNIVFSVSDKMSTYLFSFVAGEFKSVTKTVEGRTFTMLHRETDSAKVARNEDFIFYLHAASLKWLEGYTGIKYPFQKLDFALIPSFQYGGMEHVGAIQYRANALWLDKDPSQNALLGRASLIAHEVAHMWFGNLVTMDWFNDVWMKEVFANFMAAKMVNPSFPEINHELSFLTRHYPSAYSIDRSRGANAIRQELNNLNQAGQLYGPIIYNKAPIMMRQLEMLVGEEDFQKGLQIYLRKYANKNATWDDLITILNEAVPNDLKAWSEVWVNQPGRPVFEWTKQDESGDKKAIIEQKDPANKDRSWPQFIRTKVFNAEGKGQKEIQYLVDKNPYQISIDPAWTDYHVLANATGWGYGLFPASFELVYNRWENLNLVERGTLLIQLYENLWEPENHKKSDFYTPMDYVRMVKWLMVREDNQLLLNLMLGQMETVYWSLLSDAERKQVAPDLERTLIHAREDLHDKAAIKKMFFNALKDIVITKANIEGLYQIWSDREEEKALGFELSENDRIALTGLLAIHMPERAEEMLEQQAQMIENPDVAKRFDFIRPALSPNEAVRDDFFESLSAEENRETESWVLSALSYLHHPLRRQTSIQYIGRSLDWLEDIQQTGDIFFPSRWLNVTLRTHNKPEVVEIVEGFLKAHPNYNPQLRLKILQAIDRTERAVSIRN